jgi:hypothetical protein
MIIYEQLVDRLLAVRQKKPRDEYCPQMETVSLVLSGQADVGQIQKTAEHLKECEACRQVAELFHDQSPQAENVIPAKAPTFFNRQLVLWAAAGLVMIIIGLSLVWKMQHLSVEEKPTTEFVIKGHTDTLAIAVQREQTRFTAKVGDELLKGDRLGFFYSSAEPGYLVLFDLEESGQASLLYPAGKQKSGAISAGQNIALPDNGTVGKIVGCEWLVAVFSDKPLSVDSVRKELRSEISKAKDDCRFTPVVTRARTVRVFPLTQGQ